ncbi:MAG: stage II sporulation protein M [bacterium]|nr:stage II sporulation protein M [bacterium]
MKKLLMSVKEYIFSLWKFILVAALVFVFAAFDGYFSTKSSPSEMELVLKKLQEMLGPIMKLPLFSQFLFIVLNNGITAFLAIILGIIFGIFPFLVLFSNGTILGAVAYFSKTAVSWSTVFALTLPHGIIEIPIIILACAVGFKLGKISFDKVFKRQGSIKAELNTALNFFLKFLFPLLVLAAAIEVFITSRLL